VRKNIFVQQTNHGAKLLAVVVFSIVLIFIDSNWNKSAQIKSYLNSALVAPLVKIVGFPSLYAEQVAQYVSFKNSLINNYKQLQADYLLQESKLQTLESIRKENSRLRKLLNSTAKSDYMLSIANIINVDPDPFTHQSIIDKGSEHGVYVGQPVIDSSGVVGKIIGVTTTTARLMLITDASNAIPVENLRNGVRAIAIGTGTTNKLELQHVPNTVDLKVGDLLVTSGLGGKYPEGYQVGVIKDISYEPGNSFSSILVTPKAKLDKCRQVLLVDYKTR
jgi:rod shape-determining protein MreC